MVLGVPVQITKYWFVWGCIIVAFGTVGFLWGLSLARAGILSSRAPVWWGFMCENLPLFPAYWLSPERARDTTALRIIKTLGLACLVVLGFYTSL